MSDLVKSTPGYLSRPDGKVAAVGTTLLVGGGGALLYYVLPPLVVILTNLVYTVALGGALAGTAFVALNPRLRAVFNYLFRNVWRWFTNTFVVTIDPIGVLENRREDSEKEIEKLGNEIKNLRAIEEKISGEIERASGELDESFRTLAEAKRRAEAGDTSDVVQRAVAVHTQQIDRLDDTVRQFTEQRRQIASAVAVLSKIKIVTETVHENTVLDIRNRKSKREMSRAGSAGIASAKRILQGDPATNALRDGAIEYLDDDYAQKMGEIRQGIEDIGSVVATHDIRQGAAHTEAMKKLAAWEEKTQGMLSNAKGGKALSASSPAASSAKESVPARRSGSYTDLLK